MGRHHASEITSPSPASPADRLAGELQSLKNGSGLTYARLSERTHYAKSSWERWVNGKQFPPRDAVQSIAVVCGGDARLLLELWQLAESRRLMLAAPGVPGPGSGPVPGAGPTAGSAGARSAGPSVGTTDLRDADAPTGEEPPECKHRRQAAVLRRVALVSLAVGAGGVLAAAGRRTLRREA
ncbi:helix-turn-helix transcriptional regulator [Kitasatospora sp. NPDC096128]|uniref:helix-turn-helix domain-containing protein n=1 Tax=Kitasatospora sp. NPDC096128 TaxID=3155547 RepID=UPI0033213130